MWRGGSALSVYCGEDVCGERLVKAPAIAGVLGTGEVDVQKAEQREACSVRWPLIAVPTQRTFSRAPLRHKVDIAEVRPLSAAIDNGRPLK